MPGDPPRGRFPRWVLYVAAFLTVLIPFLFWQGVWFGVPLDAERIHGILADPESRERDIQHALNQLVDRIKAGDAEAQRHLPQVAALADHPSHVVRYTAAFVLQWAPHHDPFREAALAMLEDPHPLVRRQAALSLIPFGDHSGRQEILAMLRPYGVSSPVPGTLVAALEAGEHVRAGTRLARVVPPGGEMVEVRSPLDGRVEDLLVAVDTEVAEGQTLCRIAPHPDHVRMALVAIGYMGRPEDAQVVRPLAEELPGIHPQVRQQARRTLEALEAAR